ncbi:MAG: hypothetical protein ACHQ6T_19565 [Myxococcota bacterium]
MVAALWLTTLLNLFGAFVFSPLSPLALGLAGLPAEIHPLYRWTIAEFIGLFGVGYGWCAHRARAPRFFIALGAAGKLAFFATLASYWALGELPLAAVAAGSPDLWLGIAFAVWLFQSRV